MVVGQETHPGTGVGGGAPAEFRDAVATMHAARLRPETGALLRALIAGEWETVDSAPEAAAAAASGLVAAYAQWHLERGIRSLSHLEAPR